jgi:hypothetical protein
VSGERWAKESICSLLTADRSHFLNPALRILSMNRVA